MNIKNIIKNAMLLTLPIVGVGAGMLTSCSDWDDHYDGTGVEGSNTTLWEAIQSHPELSDFARVLESTKVFRMHKKTEASYANVIDGGQSFTVFAPVNGSFNADSLIALAQTNAGDSAVENYFIKNHIARTPISATKTSFRMLNGKKVAMTAEDTWGVAFKDKNIRTKNGILHITSSDLPYNKTIYENFILTDQYSLVGKAIKRYTEDVFDMEASVSSGLVEGVPVYVDSVVYENNKLINAIGLIAAEDSAYHVAIPTNEGWSKAWEAASKYFQYNKSIERYDSLQEYWTTRALLEDAIFSETTQSSMKDSVKSKWYDYAHPEYHVFYKPFEPDGIFGKADGVINCSNGYLYKYDEWPFTPTQTYFKKIEQEAEYTWEINEFKSCTYTSADNNDPRISRGGYLDIKGNADKWYVTFNLNNTLSGKYDFCVVILPKTVKDPTKKYKPCKFKAYINYIDEDGNAQRTAFGGSTGFKTTNNEIDTIVVAEDFYLPACNYNQQNKGISLTIECAVTNKENATYDRNMYIDCIYLRPKE